MCGFLQQYFSLKISLMKYKSEKKLHYNYKNVSIHLFFRIVNKYLYNRQKDIYMQIDKQIAKQIYRQSMDHTDLQFTIRRGFSSTLLGSNHQGGGGVTRWEWEGVGSANRSMRGGGGSVSRLVVQIHFRNIWHD